MLTRNVKRTCDVCGSTDRVCRYRVEYVKDSAKRSFDLCAEHGEPLEELREQVPFKGGGRAGVRHRDVVSVAAVKRARRPRS